MIYLFLKISFPARNNTPDIATINLTKTPLDCIILTVSNCVFEHFILADEPFAKALQIFGTCILVNNNLCGKLVS